MSVETHERQFTGMWIPAEVVELFDDDLINMKEMVLLATIHSFSKTQLGCFASNAYLGKTINVGEERIRQMIAHMKELRLLTQTKFDGRKRWLKTTYGNVEILRPQKNLGSPPKESLDHTPKKFGVSPQKNLGYIKEEDKTSLNSYSLSKDNERRAKPRRRDKSHSDDLLSDPTDRIHAAELRSIIMIHSPDILAARKKFNGKPASKPITLDHLTELIKCIRIEKAVEPAIIDSLLEWLRTNYGDKFTPVINIYTDFFNKWEKFIAAQKRSKNGNAPKNKTDRMMAIAEKIGEEEDG